MPRRKACESCRVKKIQCDGAQPRCEWCMHRDLVCSYGRTASKKTDPQRILKRPATVQEHVERRRARLRTLLSPEATTSDSSTTSDPSETSSETEPSNTSNEPVDVVLALYMLPKEGIFYSSTMNFAGFDLQDITAQAGIPVFCSDGLRWIQDKTGASKMFEEIYQTTGQESRKMTRSLWQADGSPHMPSRNVADTSLQAFYKSPMRRLFPVIDANAFHGTIHRAYSPGSAPISLSARTCVQALVALMKLLEPEKTLISDSDAELYSQEAQVSLGEIIVQPDIEGLQAALMLCIYHDISGNIRYAALMLGMASQCVYSLGAHLNQHDSPFSDTSGHLRDLFWLFYFLDKHISLRIGRPPMLNDNNCSLSLEGYDSMAALADTRRPLFPCNLELITLKSDVYSRLYSNSATEKSDIERLDDIRLLDDRLEAWRLSMPTFAQPRLSIVEFGTTSDVVEKEFTTWIVFTHLEYLYLLSAIHRACGRFPLSSFGAEGFGVFHTSLLLSVHASRATITYLARTSKHLNAEFFWLIIFYPVWAAVTVFSYILHDPRAATAWSDMELLRIVPRIIKDIRRRTLTAGEKRHMNLLEGFMAELLRLAQSAVHKALG